MKNNFEEIWGRIKAETGLKTLAELGQLIDKKQQTISYSKSKDDFSPAWAYLVAQKYGLLTEWIMTGNGPKRIEQPVNNKKIGILIEVEEWLCAEIKKNPKKEDWFEVQMIELFPGFKTWKEEKEGKAVPEASYPASKVA